MHALELGAAVARVQRRQLDRDARAVVDAAPGRRRADGVDRLLVGAEIALRRRPRSAPPRPACRRSSGSPRPRARAALASASLDGLAGDELLAHHAHGDVDARADHRLAAARRPRGAARAARPGLAVRGDQLAGQQQAPGRGVDEQRRAAARDARASRRCAILSRISASRVARVGNAQQRLGQAHQRHALLRADSANSCSRPCTSPAGRPTRCARAAPGRSRRASACAAGTLCVVQGAPGPAAPAASGSARR